MVGGPTAVAEEPTAPSISEIHYDNVGTDTGEALEVEAPVGFDLTGWRLALYNGNGSAVYTTRTLSGTVPDAGVVVETFPSNGIQNGSPDGVALVDPGGAVVEFLSYEGTMTAAGGPADGAVSTDIGVAEGSGTPVGHSLQKVDGVWQDPAAHTFGARNTGTDPDPEPDPVGCDIAVTNTIAEVQGTGDASPLVDSQVVIEGVVTADHRSGGYNGVYVQTAGSGDRAPAAGVASDALFVHLTSNPANHPNVAIGDRVRVRGTVSEYFGLTEITIGARTDVQVCANDATLPAAAPLSLPLDDAARESVESMVVAPVGDFTVSEVYNTNRYGEVVLAAGTEAARIPTDLHRPGTPEALAVAEANALGRIVVDDGRTTNLSSAGEAPPYVYPDAPLRVGDGVEAFGPSVLSYGFDEWRLQPTAPVNAQTPAIERTTFKSTNPRTPAPEDVGGDIRLASFNVLNYFVHFGGEARGADDEAGLARQEAKIVSAITALDADVVALEEIENSVRFSDDPQQALKRLVAALNTADGAGTWDYVRTPADLPPAAQQDVITTAIIFKPGAVTPRGASRSVDDESVWFNAREPIAQTFTAGDVTFTVVVNHFKSKSASGDPTGDNADSGDGQGAYNGDRVRQAQALTTFVEQLKTDSGSQDVLLLGDFNAYTQEDPMRVLYEASYVNLNDTGEASYVFGGESGSLDHAVASPSLADRVTGVDVWQINSHESYAFQYDGLPAFYAPDAYRASDHNPIVVGLSTAAAGPVDLNLLAINDFHGRLESPATSPDGEPIGGAAQLAGIVAEQRQQNPNTLFLSAGDNIGASTFVSAIDQDNPTLDALNLMGLDAAAVGNHEFDKGMADLTDRVIPRSEFPYLGANVYRGDERALPAHHVQTVDGVRVGIVGVVTEQTASLVSPDGIAGITFRDPVVEAEAVAAELKDGDEANGEAEVVVLLAHEGAATENIGSVEDLRADPVFGAFVDMSADVDAIFSGHTHQPYAFTAPIPGTDRLRPVVQAEEYGRKLGRATLQVDPATGAVLGTGAELIEVVGGPVDPAVEQLVADAKANAEVLGQRPLGEITADIRRAFTPEGNEDRGSESVLGNFIADVQLAGTADPGRGGAQIAFMNPGGLRSDLVFAPDGVVTYAEAFAVQPFANDVVTRTYTGAQIKQVLEEQWQPAGASRPKLHLGVSEGFTYTYLPDNPAGQRITSMSLDGVPIEENGTYRVTVNSFLAAGGDNFFTLAEGTDQATTGDNDLTMLTEYLATNSPVTADPESRATIGDPRPEPECTETITGLRLWRVDVSSGTTCLDDAVVLGSVRVGDGASLAATDGVIIGGLTAVGPQRVTLSGTQVLGLVTATGATGEVTVEQVRMAGPLTLLGNQGGLRIDGSRITGPVSLVGNTGGEHVVAANTITGLLSCLRNDPAPTDADRPNTVRGAVVGQCRQL